MKTLVVRIPDTLDAELGQLARTRQVSKSVIVRERLSAAAEAGQPSLWARMKDLVITDDSLPTDLSSNKKHFKGYGKDRASR
jgi:Ribbon-helix-helix protein, copG family